MLHQRGLTLRPCRLVTSFSSDRKTRWSVVSPFSILPAWPYHAAPIFSGVACVYLRQFKTQDFLETLSKEKVTHYLGVVNVIWLMVNHPHFDQYDFSSFKKALLGGSFATEEMVGYFQKLPQLQISVGYGLTESFAIVTSTPFEDALRKIKAVGRLLPLMEARIVDEEGRELPLEATGEILLKGPKIFKGYGKNRKPPR